MPHSAPGLVPSATEAAYLSDLRRLDLPEPPMLFENRIPTGVTIVYARPGCGKSMLGAQIEEHIAWNRPLGTWKSEVHGDCLVIDFEGNQNLAKSRSLRITPFGAFAFDLADERPEHNIRYEFGLKGRTFPERMGSLIALLDEKAAAGKPYVYMRIDTLNALIGPAPKGMNSADWASQALIPVNQEMMKRNMTCLIMHHTNKGGEMSGSVVLSGSVTAVLEMERGANDGEGVIRTKKMRVAAEWEMACTYENGLWQITEELTPEQVARTSIPRKILDFLAANRGIANKGEIEANVNALGNTIKMALSRMKADGVLKYRDGYWILVNLPAERVAGHVQAVVDQWPDGTIGAAQNTYPPSTPGDAPDKSQEVTPPPSPQQGRPRSVLPALQLDPTPDPESPKTGAIKASMRLMKQSVQRDTARYKPSLFAAQPDIPKTDIWEGRNKYSTHIEPGTPMIRLDKCAAYLSAANTRLPIGPLQPDDDPLSWATGNKVGYHQISNVADSYLLGGPFASRLEKGRVWVTTPTLKQLFHYHHERNWATPDIHASWTAPGTEVLLRPWIDVLKLERAAAIESGDDARYAFVKFCYSLSISTMGESTSNFEIRRPDWMHIIRAQAYANLWRKALQANAAGVDVRKVGNTDEIWAVHNPAALDFFDMGRNLGQYSIKSIWVQE